MGRRPADGKPLTLDLDTQIEYGGFPPTPSYVHARVYRGSQGAVVLLSKPLPRDEHRYRASTSWLEPAALALHQVYTRTDLREATWIVLTPEHRFGPASHSMHPDDAAATRITRASVHTTGRRRRATPRLYVRITHESPTLTRTDLHALLGGAPVDFFDWEHYTPENLALWHETRTPLSIGHARQNYADLADTLDHIETHPGIPRHVKDAAWQPILVELQLQHQEHKRDTDDAPTTPEAKTRDRNASQHVNTSSRTPYALPDRLLASLPFPGHAARTDVEDLQACRLTLTTALHNVDEYADEPDPELATAFQRALSSQDVHDRLVPPHVTLTPPESAAARVLSFLHASQWDSQYASSINWSDTDPRLDTHPLISRRQARELAKATLAPDDGDIIFGVDPFGNPTARHRTHENTHSADATRYPDSSLVTVLWPTYTNLTTLPEHTRLVATGGTGDRPVYLAHGSAIIGLLPRTNHTHLWNFGYGGGGPGYLTTAANELITTQGRPDRERLLARHIQHETHYDALDVDLDALT